MHLVKNGVRFNVDVRNSSPELVEWWEKGYPHWEEQTFRVLDRFLSARSSYLDVGAWVGPTVLYAAARARRVFCLEPDPVAYQALIGNIQANPGYRNIEAFDYCLAGANGTCRFGGNGALGNSESTMRADDSRYARQAGALPRKADGEKERAWRAARTIEVTTVTIERLADLCDLSDCSLVKIDIEGGEKIVIPAISAYLRSHRPTLYLSLHWVYLRQSEVARVVTTVADIYGNLYLPDLRTRVRVDEVVATRAAEIVCTDLTL